MRATSDIAPIPETTADDRPANVLAWDDPVGGRFEHGRHSAILVCWLVSEAVVSSAERVCSQSHWREDIHLARPAHVASGQRLAPEEA